MNGAGNVSLDEWCDGAAATKSLKSAEALEKDIVIHMLALGALIEGAP